MFLNAVFYKQEYYRLSEAIKENIHLLYYLNHKYFIICSKTHYNAVKINVCNQHFTEVNCKCRLLQKEEIASKATNYLNDTSKLK